MFARLQIVLVVLAIAMAGCMREAAKENCLFDPAPPGYSANYPDTVPQQALREAFEENGWEVANDSAGRFEKAAKPIDTKALTARAVYGQSVMVLTIEDGWRVVNDSAEAEAYLAPHVEPLIQSLDRRVGEPVSERWIGGSRHCGGL